MEHFLFLDKSLLRVLSARGKRMSVWQGRTNATHAGSWVPKVQRKDAEAKNNEQRTKLSQKTGHEKEGPKGLIDRSYVGNPRAKTKREKGVGVWAAGRHGRG